MLNHGRLNAWDRRMYKPVVEQAVWRTRRDQELWKLREGLDTVAHIKKKKTIKRLEHLVKTDGGRTVQTI
jgi:hypothetical protein